MAKQKSCTVDSRVHITGCNGDFPHEGLKCHSPTTMPFCWQCWVFPNKISTINSSAFTKTRHCKKSLQFTALHFRKLFIQLCSKHDVYPTKSLKLKALHIQKLYILENYTIVINFQQLNIFENSTSNYVHGMKFLQLKALHIQKLSILENSTIVISFEQHIATIKSPTYPKTTAVVVRFPQLNFL